MITPPRHHPFQRIFQMTGTKYNKGRGLRVFADGREIARSETLGRVTAPLPE